MVSLRNQLFDDQLMVIVRKLHSVDDMNVLVELRLRVNHGQVCDHIVILESILLQELVLSL